MTAARPHYQAVNILLVDDDDIDIEALKRAFESRRIRNPLHVARDGEEALAMLRGETSAHVERPCMVLLDLNLPRMHGLDVLRQMRADPHLRDIVVFVLTSSESRSDVYQAYELNVAGYMLKSEVGEDFVNCTDMLEHYWRVVTLPG